MGSKSDMTSSLGMETVHQAFTIDYDKVQGDLIDMIDPELEYTQEGELFCSSRAVQNHTELDDFITSNSLPEEGGYMEIQRSGKVKVRPNGKEAGSRRKKQPSLNVVGKAKFKSSKNRKEPWSCQFCDRTFTQRSSKHRHEKLHLGLKPHKCRFCERAFTRKYILDEHERVHTGVTPHRCTVCSAAYTLKTCLRKHELEHFGGQPHDCPSCNGELIKPALTPSPNKKSEPGSENPLSLHGEESEKSGTSIEAVDPEIDTSMTPLEKPFPEAVADTNTPEMDKKEKKIPSPALECNSPKTGRQETTASPAMKSVSQLSSKRTAVKSLTARRHKCYQCGKSFGSSRVLQMHKRVHESDGRFRCRFCGKAFSMRTVLQEHENQHKLMEEQSYSPAPPTESSILHSFLQEAKKAQEQDDEEQVSRTLQPLTVEADDVHEGERDMLPPEKPYMCLYCMKAFRHTCRLVKHARKYRGSCFDPTIARPIPRNASHAAPTRVIGSSAVLDSSVEQHQKKEKSRKPKRRDSLDSVPPRFYKCNVCSVTFNQRTSLQIHKRKHTRGKQHLCHICDLAFVGKAQLLQHQQNRHSDDPGCPPEEKEVSKVTDFVSNGLDGMPHLQAESPIGEAVLGPDSSPTGDGVAEDDGAFLDGEVAAADQEVYACVYCSQTFNSFPSLRSHQEECHQSKSYSCPRCGTAFGDRADLQAHMSVHAEERPFRCGVPACRRSFVKEENYRRHQEHHGRDKRHKCSYCEKTFERNSYRLQHERIHTGERPFTCRFCAKTFAQRNSMQRHEIIHLGIKKYRCDICEKAFGRRESLQNHILTHTKGIKADETTAAAAAQED